MGKIYLKNGAVLTGIANLENNTVVIEDEKISDVISEKRFKEREIGPDDQVIDVQDAYISPGFIDTHIHGLHGHDTTDATPEAIHAMSEALIEYGVTSFCPTIYPQAEDDMLKSIRNIVDVMGNEKGAEILGMHLEGPFISRDKLGVMKKEHLREVDLDLMRKLYDAAEGNITIMTVAPEIKNMRDLALFGTKNNIVMAAGHSNAHYEHMVEGMQAGILHSTHFFNAMRRLHHRDPGVVGGIMIHPNISCEIIADGYHVHPAIINLLLRVKPINKLVLVTDALKPTGQKSGKLIANNEEVYLKDGLFRRKSDDTIAGSGLTMIRGVDYLHNEIDLPVLDAIKMASCNPATVISHQYSKGYIIPGKGADITVFDEDFNIKMVMKAGKILSMNL
jgi:N-acetylglucosamine-6-phosphate deacetylase